MTDFDLRHIAILKDELFERKKRNHLYSLRSFAKSLDISADSFSRILNNKRPLTLDRALSWKDKLNLMDDTYVDFIESVKNYQYQRLDETHKKARQLTERYDYHLLQLDQFELISNWYHIVILNLTELSEFESSPEWIAKKLGIDVDDTIDAINRLKRLGLLVEDNGKILRTLQRIETPTDTPSQAIRKYHQDNIERALYSLNNDIVELRDISSITMPLDPANLEEAKKRIKIFRKEMSEFLQTGSGQQVYSLNVQLFPQTRDFQ
ncbi:TIGR02147 family protein [Bacteriovorax sp. Seq25_V]|uniref:TIGR02147 family protein n=1 Tax=Bacteriovorax sp. Seq25_V TaxID=1201288 RepID=UPI000389FEB8|nr:TIGR02147 family protein [Bacteriovorax sp. Seq25_V]EQC45545.1 TIGR02147 family protein [Bacteriovorax sp. Seq25_V]